MKKLLLAFIAVSAMGIGAAQAEPIRLTDAQMDSITAGTHYRATGGIMAYMFSLAQLHMLGHDH